MGQISSGVSGGSPVSNVTTGVPLSAVGDYAILFVSNAASPEGPDVSGLIALSGLSANASVSVLSQFNAVAPPVPLTSVSVNGASIGYPYTVPSGGASLVIGGIQGLYSVRVVLNSVGTGGPVIVQGLSNPSNSGSSNAALLAAVQGLQSVNLAQVIGLSLLADVDLLQVATNGAQQL